MLTLPQENAVFTSYIGESMPTMSELGTEYLSFPAHFGGNGGYLVRIIAVEDNTQVTVPSFSTILNLDQGEFHVVDNRVTKFAFNVSCSKPCMVVQFLRSLWAGGETDRHMQPFMSMLIPDDSSSNSLIFTVPSQIETHPSTRCVIAIITNTFPPTRNLYLNDTYLSYLDWVLMEDSASWYATFEIEAGSYQLYSNDLLER